MEYKDDIRKNVRRARKKKKILANSGSKIQEEFEATIKSIQESVKNPELEAYRDNLLGKSKNKLSPEQKINQIIKDKYE
jgi:hypothetical protein